MPANRSRAPGDPMTPGIDPGSADVLDRASRALGWFSYALGAIELLAARDVVAFLGMEGSETLVRAYGLREIGAGVVSLSVDRDTGMWMRVCGDALDIATLLVALRPRRGKIRNVVAALATVIGVTTADILVARSLAARP